MGTIMAKNMTWSKLICNETIAKDRTKGDEGYNPYKDSPFEDDYRWIISSSVFRRLQDKTQVFPLDKSDFVRTRLTHSLETSAVAKQLGNMIFNYPYDNNVNAKNLSSDAKNCEQKIQDILSCAGLLHDLGNPPFGHFGEELIGQWFRTKFEDDEWQYDGKKIVDCLNEQMRHDLENFNGNAQNIRLIAKAYPSDKEHDLNLTCSTVQTLIKYPYPSNEAKKKGKFGYFCSEKDFVKMIAEKTETINDKEIYRHPLTCLLEAADDIAYATSDLEDAFVKDSFTLADFIKFYNEEINRLYDNSSSKNDNMLKKPKELIKVLEDKKETAATRIEELVAFNIFVRHARSGLMYTARYGFINNYDEIMNGTYKEDLLHGTYHELSIKALKKAMRKFVYSLEGIVRLELSAQTIIFFLLDRFIPAAITFDVEKKEKEDDKNENIHSLVHKKALDLIPENLKNEYRNKMKPGDENYNLYLRLLMVTDFISGMTDSYAKNLYQDLN